MAEKLLQYYKYIADQKGLVGQMELAKITKIPAARAATSSDDKATLELFQDAVQKITGKPAPTF